jgi:hypothetical protein
MLLWSARAPCLHGRLSSNVRQHTGTVMVLTIAAGTAVAAKYKVHSQRTSEPDRTRRCGLARAPRREHLRSTAIAARFAGIKFCRSHRRDQPVRGAAVRRQLVPAVSARGRGNESTACSSSQRRRVCNEQRRPRALSHQSSPPLCVPRAVLPNWSLEWTATGKALGPRGSQVYAPPRGPSAFPASAPQLKR